MPNAAQHLLRAPDHPRHPDTTLNRQRRLARACRPASATAGHFDAVARDALELLMAQIDGSSVAGLRRTPRDARAPGQRAAAIGLMLGHVDPETFEPGVPGR